MYWHVRGKKCCVECFSHQWVREYILENSTGTGTCHYCNRRKRKLIEVAELSTCFESLLRTYERSESWGGDSLTYLIQGSWQIFPESLVESGIADRLLQDIMAAGWDDDSGEPFPHPNEPYHRASGPNLVETWEEFLQGNEADSLLLDFVKDEDLPLASKTVPMDTILFRARIGWESEEYGTRTPWRGPKIGPSPERKPGRANLDGEVVLYCADQEQTAVSEVRPARGYLVSVCRIKIMEDIEILDLSRPLEPPNPFLTDHLLYDLEFLGLLDTFAETLSNPLERNDKPEEDYLPSQKLAGYIRSAGFKGIQYPSALDSSGGTNFVIFDPSICSILESKLVKVTDTTITMDDETEWV